MDVGGDRDAHAWTVRKPRAAALACLERFDARRLRLPSRLSARWSWRRPRRAATAPARRGPAPVDVERPSLLQRRADRAQASRSAPVSCGSTARARAVELAVLVAVVRRPPAALGRAGPAPAARGAAAAAALSVGARGGRRCRCAALARERAKDVGLVTPGWAGCAGDVAKARGDRRAAGRRGRRRCSSSGCAASAGAGGSGGSVVVVAFGVLTHLRGPGGARSALQPLHAAAAGSAAPRRARPRRPRRASTSVRSTRSTPRGARRPPTRTSPASGRTKRVVLYDKLLRDFSPAEVRLVVAHELGHVRHHDVPRGLLWLALVAPLGMWAAALVGRAPGRDRARRGPRPCRRWRWPSRSSRRRWRSSPTSSRAAVEQRADAFSLALTRDPRTLIAFQQRIAVQNVADPEPPGWQTVPARHPSADARADRAGRRVRAGMDKRGLRSLIGLRVGDILREELSFPAHPAPPEGSEPFRRDFGEVLDALAWSATWTSCPPWRRSARA